jgi:hypothetical protein
MSTQKNTARKAEKIDTENPRINLTKNLIKRGVDLLKKLDATLTSVDESRSKFKAQEQKLGEDLLTYIASFGNNLNYQEILFLKNTLYDALLWKRVGAKQKGRVKVNQTINKYFSLIFSFVKSEKDGGSGQNLNSETKFADVRSAYSEVGLKKPIKDANYEISKEVRKLFRIENLKNATHVKTVKNDILKALSQINKT